MMDSLSDQDCIKRFSPQSLRPLQSTLNQFYSSKANMFFYFMGKVRRCKANISRRSYLADAMDTRQAGAKLEQEKIEKCFAAFVYIYILHCTYTQSHSGIWIYLKHRQQTPQAFQGWAQHIKLASSILLP